MNLTKRKIAFKVELSRMLELLADQIYQSPFALLRENTQNAFDAVRMRQALPHQNFEPIIKVSMNEAHITVSDNGIGMSAQEIESNFWYAGKSGKNTAAARAAGVVGTFGIGALANFGVADELRVETESAITSERTISYVRKSELSTESENISLLPIAPTGESGTIVKAALAPSNKMSVQESRKYLRDFVEFVDIPVLFNGEKISGASYRSYLPSEKSSWSNCLKNTSLSGLITGNLEILGMASGELRIVFEDIQSLADVKRLGTMVLLQGRNVVRTLRTGFGLATVGINSTYNWGGVVDLPFLKPTAGREALDSASTQILQQIFSSLDNLISSVAVEHTESFANNGFLRWIVARQEYSLCGLMEVVLQPKGNRKTLASLVQQSGVRYFEGRNESVIRTYASEDEPLIVLSQRAPRRTCELGYLRRKGIRRVDTKPHVTQKFNVGSPSLTIAHAALAMRVARVLEDDYFLQTEICFGLISENLPVLVTREPPNATICLDPKSSSVAPLLSLYREDYSAFGAFVKDFIRSTVFPRISNLVPSSTREGAEAFLRHLRSNREWFEYEIDDKASLEEIFNDLHFGRLSLTEATNRLAKLDRSFVEVSRAGTASLSSVIHEPNSETNQNSLPDPFVPVPGIDRREEETNALFLTSEAPVNGYKNFLALSDRVHREKGDFFLQPHSTEVVWGGRKVIFIFHHHSRRFGLYYDILCPGLVGSESGGGLRVTATILTKNRTFIPIPDEISKDFVPNEDERKRLEVRCDILYLVEE